MGGVRLSGRVLGVDRRISLEPRASGRASLRTNPCRGAHPHAVRELCKSRASRRRTRAGWGVQKPAFLAALVSASFLPVLLRRDGAARASDLSRLVRRETDGLRPLAHRSEPASLARTLRASGAQRVHGVRLFHLLPLPPDPRRNSVFPAGFPELLGGDDLFGGGLRLRIR